MQDVGGFGKPGPGLEFGTGGVVHFRGHEYGLAPEDCPYAMTMLRDLKNRLFRVLCVPASCVSL